MAESKDRQEFRVVFEGIQFPAETVERLEAAIQKAVTDELAVTSLDTGSLVERPLGPPGGGLVGLQFTLERDE